MFPTISRNEIIIQCILEIYCKNLSWWVSVTFNNSKCKLWNVRFWDTISKYRYRFKCSNFYCLFEYRIYFMLKSYIHKCVSFNIVKFKFLKTVLKFIFPRHFIMLCLMLLEKIWHFIFTEIYSSLQFSKQNSLIAYKSYIVQCTNISFNISHSMITFQMKFKCM